MKRNNMCPFCFIKSLFQKKKPTSVNPQLPDYENGVALTPPMGWSSWNTFRNRINEKLILDTAKAMKDNGLIDAGYKYINLRRLLAILFARRKRRARRRLRNLS